jgi:hypothetical protein
MQVPIKNKTSSVAGKVPALADIQLGELAINTHDGKLFTRKDDGTPAIIELGGGGAMALTASASTAYTLVGDDAGNFVTVDAGGSINVPSGVFETGSLITVVNNTATEADITFQVPAWITGLAAQEDVVVLAPRGMAQIIFTSESTCIVTGDVRYKTAISYLIIGGGGSTGKGQNGYCGGAGGAGGFIEGDLVDVAGQTFHITVGGSNGNTVVTNYDWFTATALAGGGGNPYGPSQGMNGGSGAGRHYSGAGGTAQQPLQSGYSQGYGNNGARSAGGGAGSAASGYAPGAGRASSITGTSVMYASGGPTPGYAYLDGYYGRGGMAAASGYGDAGIQGIVVIRASRQAESFIGSPSVSQIGTDWLYQFFSAATIEF